MKKFLSVILTLALVLGNFSILFTGTVSAAEYNPNVLAGTTAADWHSSWTADAGYKPVAITDGTATFKAYIYYHSVYTQVTLKPNTSYTLTFGYKGEGLITDVDLTPVSNISNPVSGGLAMADATDTSLDYVKSVSVGSNESAEEWYTATAEIKTGEETDYYLILDGDKQIDITDSYTYFKDFSLTVSENILGGTTAADWRSSWTTDAGYKPVAVNDGTATFKAFTYYHSVYTQVTLKPNTSYTLTFGYKGEGLITDVDLTPVSNISNPVSGGLAMADATDTSLDYVKSVSVGSNESAEEWYTATAEIKTGEETDYYLILDGDKQIDITDSYTYFKDFSLTVETDVLKYTTAADWYSGWQASLNPTADTSGIATFSAKYHYHSIYTIVNLKPNTQYELNFTYIGDTDVEDVRLVTENEIDTAKTPLPHLNAEANNGGSLVLVDGAKDYVTYKSIPTADSNTTYYNVSAIINTGDAITYYLLLDNNGGQIDSANNKLNGATYFMDFSLDIQPNVMADLNMENADWYSMWGTSLRDDRAQSYMKDLDKTESYSQGAYAMSFVGGARYRTNFTYVTLKPNTTYDFSFMYKVNQYLNQVGIVDASMVDVAASGDNIEDKFLAGYSIADVLGRLDRSAGQLTSTLSETTWNRAYTSFTTGNATEYILYFNTNSGDTNVDTYATISDFALMAHPVVPVVEVEDPNVLADSSAENWYSGWTADRTATESNGVFSIGSLWHSFYTKVALKPNTEYDFSFSFRNTNVSDIRVYSALEISSPSTQLLEANATVKGGTNDLVVNAPTISGKPYVSDSSYDAETFYTASASFTTGIETEYYIVVDCGNSAGVPSGSTDKNIYFKDLYLAEYVQPAPAGQLEDPANWRYSTDLNKTATATTVDGKPAITTAGGSWRDTCATVTLNPNTKYTVSFKYKGNTDEAKISWLRVFGANDTEYTSGDHICEPLKDGATYCYNNYISLTANDWETVSFNFTTNDNTVYYMVFDHGTNAGGFTAYDFSVEELPLPTPAEQYGTYTNWSSTRTSAVFTSAASGNGVTCTTDVSWVDTYATVTLEPYTKYSLSFNYQGDTVISNMVILAKNDSTRTSEHICNQISEGASYCLNTSMGGYTYSADTATAISVEFTTNANTEYYIIFDHGDDSAVGFTVSDISFEEVIPPAPDKQLADATNWKAIGRTVTFSSAEDGKSVTATGAPTWADTYATVTLEPNTKYSLSFTYQGASAVNKMYVMAASDWSGEYYNSTHLCTDALKEGASMLLTHNMATTDGYNYDGQTANSVSVTFTTTIGPEYYIIFDHGEGAGFTVSDISFAEEEKADDVVGTNMASDYSVESGHVIWSTKQDYINPSVLEDSRYTAKDDSSITYNGGKGWKITLNSETEDKALYGYIKAVGLKANTKYTFTYTYSMDYKVKLLDIIDSNADQVPYESVIQVLEEKADPLLRARKVNITFTTTDAADYLISLVTGYESEFYAVNGGKATVMVGDLVVDEYVEPTEEKPTNLLENVSSLEWKSTWNTVSKPTTATITKADDTCNGGDGIKVSSNNYREAYTLIELEANSLYELKFKYKGATVLSDIAVYAADDIDASVLVNDSGSASVTPNSEISSMAYYVDIGEAFDGETWNDVTAKIATNENTLYYLALVGGAKIGDISGFTASDFSLVKVNQSGVDAYYDFEPEETPEDDAEQEGSSNLLSGYTYENWFGRNLSPASQDATSGDISAYAAWGHGFTKVALEANTEYTFSITHRDVAIGDIKVYLASDVETDGTLVSQSNNQYYEFGSATNYATGIKSYDATLSSNTLPDGTNYYTASETFTTATAGDYYIIIEGLNGISGNNIYIKEASLEEVLPPTPAEQLEDPANWRYSTDLNKTATATTVDGKAAIKTAGGNWRDTCATVTLNPNTKYTVSFKYKGNSDGATISKLRVFGANDTEYTSGDHICGSLKAGATYCYDNYITLTATEWQTISFTFTTNDNTVYYMVFDHGANVGGFTAYDFSVEELPPPTPAEQLADPINWNSTWNITSSPNAATFTVGTESKDGTVGIATTRSNYRDSFAKVTLEAYTRYNLAFNYKGVSELYFVQVFAVNDIDATKMVNGTTTTERVQSALKEGAAAIVEQRIEGTYNGTTWNSVEVPFTTNANTEYYVVFYHTENSGFTASDISLEEVLPAEGVGGAWITTSRDIIGGAETTEEDPEQLGKGYITYACNNDALILPFFYNSGSKYTVSFDIKGINAGTSGVQMQFHAAPNGRLSGEFAGSALTYRGDAVTVLRKDIASGKLLEAPFTFNNATEKSTEGINNTASSIYKGLIHTFTAEDAIFTGWQHYQIEIDPSAIYYEGLANLCFYGVGSQIAIDNFKVEVVPEDTLKAATEGFRGTYAYAIRKAIIENGETKIKQGLRTVSTIDLALRDADANGFKVVEYGTLAVKRTNLYNETEKKYEALVYEMRDLSKYKVKYGSAYSVAEGKDKVYKKITDNSGKVTAVSYSGVLTGISSTNFGADYAVRAYMILEDADGVRTVVYDELDARSVYEVTKFISENATDGADKDAAQSVIDVNKDAYDTWNPEGSASKTANITVSTGSNPIITNYRGFSGTVYHAFGFMQDDKHGRAYNSDMLNIELDRLQELGMVYMRTRFQSQWIFNDVTGYNWNSDRLGYFFDYAKALEERDMEVILQAGWHFDFISKEGTHSIEENAYFFGDGDDLYGESNGYDTAAAAATVSDVTDGERIVKAARRYGYMVGQTLKVARARGINNINYLAYFVEPSNAYSTPEGKDTLKAGHDKEEYYLFCKEMKQKLSEMGEAESVKHMGPNEAGYSALLEYIISKDPNLFDINSAHFYNAAGDNFAEAEDYNDYYKRATTLGQNNMEYDSWWDKITGNGTEVNASNRSFENYKSLHSTILATNTDSEFWVDEFNVIFNGANYETKGTDNAWAGLALAMNAIAAQQRGMQNMVAWMAFDQLWSDRSPTTGGANTEFSAGIHTTQNNLAPSLFMSGTPYTQYYTSGLFTKYNGHKDGSVYQTNNDDLQSATNTQGVYVGAVKLEDGNWTITVVNMRSEAMNINVSLTAAINQTLYRHVQRAADVEANVNAKLAGADKSFNVADSFSDTIPAGSIAVYTGVAD